MTKRGTILKDTQSGPGLLLVEGNRYVFTLERMWQSRLPPRVGMNVEVTFHPDYGIASVRDVPEIQPVRHQAKSTVDVPQVVAFVTLAAGWLFLPSVEVGAFGFDVSINFWQLLNHLGEAGGIASFNPRASGDELFSALGVVALTGSWLPLLWKDRRAALAGIVPLLLMAVVSFSLLHSIQEATRGVSEVFGGELTRSLARPMMDMVHIGSGAYLSLAASIYLTYAALREYLPAGQ